MTPEELAYILDNSGSKILITSTAKREVALQAMAQCPRIDRCVVVDGLGDGDRVPSPVMLHQVPRYLAHRAAAGGGDGKLAVLVTDGLATDQWAVLRQQMRFRVRSSFKTGTLVSRPEPLCLNVLFALLRRFRLFRPERDIR